MITVKKKTQILIVACYYVILILGLVMADRNEAAWIVYAAPGDNNLIKYVAVYDFNATANTYNLIGNHSSAGFTDRVHDGWRVRFIVSVQSEKALFTSEAQAKTYTNVNMTIDHAVWTKKDFNYTNNWDGGTSGTYYYFVYRGDWNSTLPAAGTTYSCTLSYGTYY